MFGRTKAAKSAPVDPAQLQKAYWTVNPSEKTALLARFPDALSWQELLRLQHLVCLELANQVIDGKRLLDMEFSPTLTTADGPLNLLARQISEKLLTPESPYRTRHCDVWQSQAQESRQPDLSGNCRNASVTHLGCLEVIRLEQQQPKELAFIPFDDIQAIVFAGPALFRAARVFYDNGQADEIVLVPLLYGISWSSKSSYDRDGSMTRFMGHVATSQGQIGIGIGHQDLLIDSERGHSALGIGSVAQLATALEIADPRFDSKARGRGINPDEVRRQLGNR